jgi:eukaryotic-like serine/threonine-protein kinase
VEEDLERAADQSKVWATLYPRDNVAWEMLGNISILIGRYRDSMAAAREAVKLGPKSPIAYWTLAESQKCSNLFDDSKATCREALAHGLNSAWFHNILFEVSCAQRDPAGVARAQTEWEKDESERNVTLDKEGLAAATAGRIRFAHEKFRAAIQVARKERLPNAVDSVLLDEALVDLFAGFLSEARAEAEKVPLDDEPDMIAQSGLAAALSGGTSYAEKAIARLRGSPKISVLRARVDLPLVEAAVAIYQKKAADAIKLLEPTQVYELSRYFIPFLRGRAFLDAKIPALAITEYRTVTENPGIDPVSPMYPLAYLGLARAYSLQGRHAGSRAAYERFFDLWKDADSNLPVVLEARREYAELPPN